MASSAAAWDAMEGEQRLTDSESVRVSEFLSFCRRLREAEVGWELKCGVCRGLEM